MIGSNVSLLSNSFEKRASVDSQVFIQGGGSRSVTVFDLKGAVLCLSPCSLNTLLQVMSGYQLDEFAVGQVKAHMHHGLGAAEISRIILKRDGKTHFSEQAIRDCVNKLKEDRNWRGGREEGSGRPRKTTKAQDKLIVNAVLKHRGKEKVTVPWIKKRFMWARLLGNTLLEERLEEAGLAYMRRRRKTLVPEKYLQERVRYCEGVKRKHQETLNQWAYADGTTFYLDKTLENNESTQRAALGCYVWRRSDCRDALFADCVGPSSYNKAQGRPVRIWGALAQGVLHVHVLEEGEVMDSVLYTELIEDCFEDWLVGCNYLVQDFEKCLRTPGPLKALADLDVQLVEDYPRCSQDFNAIENAWKLLRDRLYDTMPKGLESRQSFVLRLQAAVSWLNRKKADSLWYLSTNQKERATDCLNLRPKGARTKW